MTREQVKDKIYNYLEGCDSSDFFKIGNEYYDSTGNGERLYEMDEFEDEMSNYSYADVINMAQNGGFDDSEGYFYYDSYSLNTTDYVSELFDLGEMAGYCVEYDNDLGDSEIRDLLDKISDNDFTITLRYSEDSFDTFTLDTLEETSTVDKSELYYGKEGCLMKLSEWIEEIEESNDEENYELYKLDLNQLLRDKGAVRLSAVGYHGWVFNLNEYVDGRPARYFYNVENDILLKLVYDADKTGVLDNSYRYIVECADHSVNGVFQLVRAL